MNQRHTDKELLVKGLKRMALTLILMFIGPVVVHSSFENQDKPLYYPVLIIGITICITAIVMGFKGIKIIMDAVFGKKIKR
ncbi:DUF6095 family protein [Sungkyunkwania multivorans]|uniref:DUF6095 family protein n=1 Tax=Sungkyunkwania multivorans TaxID=1173618 RepID=A0ABW3CZ15_9FLAO